jgi:hypothetical protein
MTDRSGAGACARRCMMPTTLTSTHTSCRWGPSRLPFEFSPQPGRTCRRAVRDADAERGVAADRPVVGADRVAGGEAAVLVLQREGGLRRSVCEPSPPVMPVVTLILPESSRTIVYGSVISVHTPLTSISTVTGRPWTPPRCPGRGQGERQTAPPRRELREQPGHRSAHLGEGDEAAHVEPVVGVVPAPAGTC